MPFIFDGLLLCTDTDISHISYCASVCRAGDNGTKARLRQGLDHLREMQLPVIRASTGDFIRWVWQDTQKEEADSIAELGLDRAALGKAVSKRALEWYHARLQKKTASAGEEASAADASDGSDG